MDSGSSDGVPTKNHNIELPLCYYMCSLETYEKEHLILPLDTVILG